MASLGERLKAEREKRGVVLDEVHEATRIQKRYLEALERQDWGVFPGAVFAQGYLRTYAQYLGLDAQQALRAYARERRIEHAESGADREAAERAAARAVLERIARTRGVEPASGRRAGRGVAVGLTAVVVLSLALWGVLRLYAAWTAADATERGPTETRARRQPLPTAADPVSPPSAAPLRDVATRDDPSPPGIPTVDTAPAAPLVPPASSAPRLGVPQYGVGTRVVDHQLVGQNEEFAEGGDVWFWTHVVGGRPGDRVEHVWFHGSRRIAVVRLRVGGASWRTQSRRTLREGSAGRWTVEVRDREGRVLASASFRVTSD